jgi:mRNA-degrading endonuclease HigB of HigAB toxin-antitoxin module
MPLSGEQFDLLNKQYAAAIDPYTQYQRGISDLTNRISQAALKFPTAMNGAAGVNQDKIYNDSVALRTQYYNAAQDPNNIRAQLMKNEDDLASKYAANANYNPFTMDYSGLTGQYKTLSDDLLSKQNNINDFATALSDAQKKQVQWQQDNDSKQREQAQQQLGTLNTNFNNIKAQSETGLAKVNSTYDEAMKKLEAWNTAATKKFGANDDIKNQYQTQLDKINQWKADSSKNLDLSGIEKEYQGRTETLNNIIKNGADWSYLNKQAEDQLNQAYNGNIPAQPTFTPPVSPIAAPVAAPKPVAQPVVNPQPVAPKTTVNPAPVNTTQQKQNVMSMLKDTGFQQFVKSNKIPQPKNAQQLQALIKYYQSKKK